MRYLCRLFVKPGNTPAFLIPSHRCHPVSNIAYRLSCFY
ncbi:hypothetical protein D083_0780 [Dickeya solani RNS 08.23.3.1.A]|nr:hypothetical protein D083_0780 [Dickeya solani RNS 08.23.3.1.A]